MINIINFDKHYQLCFFPECSNKSIPPSVLLVATGEGVVHRLAPQVEAQQTPVQSESNTLDLKDFRVIHPTQKGRTWNSAWHLGKSSISLIPGKL